MLDQIFFAWDGADHPDGPWKHLRVVRVDGFDAISEPYSLELELVRPPAAPDISPEDLLDRTASLRIATGTVPAFSVFHGIVTSVEELGLSDTGTTYKVTLKPALFRASLTRRSTIFLDKTVQEIITEVLSRVSGPDLDRNDSPDLTPDDGDLDTYVKARHTFTFRCIETEFDRKPRSFCVQYDESDFDFVCRLLEEEGVSYHYEHARSESVLVFTNFDGGRSRVPSDAPLGARIEGRELDDFRTLGKLLPRSVSTNDYNFRNPKLSLFGTAPNVPSGIHTHHYPGGFENGPEEGRRYAQLRKGALDAERFTAKAKTRCRALHAGQIFPLEHSQVKFDGDYLITRLRFRITQPASFGGEPTAPTFVGDLECLKVGEGDSNYLPAIRTARPRIYGSQTAIVTAEASDAGASINVNDPDHLGSVRVRFHWDLDGARVGIEPTSAWIRVSQAFAGASHGALFNPRVGDEVIVSFLDGNPDRPIVVGRVYNGLNQPPVDPNQHPTLSALKSYSVPHNDKFNMLAFESQAGHEEIELVAARDLNVTVNRNASRSVTGSDSTSGGSVSLSSGTTLSVSAQTDMNLEAQSQLVLRSKQGFHLHSEYRLESARIALDATADLKIAAQECLIRADTTLAGGKNLQCDVKKFEVTGGQSSLKTSTTNIESSTVDIRASSLLIAASKIIIAASQLEVQSPDISIGGGTIKLNT